LDDAERPVADGTYKVIVATDEATTGETSALLDSTPPAISLRTPARLASARALVVQVSDMTSGVHVAQLKVDGVNVRQLAAGTSSLLYRPARGWRAGRHQVSVTATDAAGNRTQKSFTFVATVPSSAFKASCIYQALSVRPKSCFMAASPNASNAETSNLAGLRWSTWGGSRAVGHGYERGMHLPFAHIPVTVVFTRPAYVEEIGVYVYKHFRVTSRYGTTSGTIQANQRSGDAKVFLRQACSSDRTRRRYRRTGDELQAE
jgi:hypothetical protein